MQNRAAIMPSRSAEGRSQRVAVVLFDQFSNHCLANTIEPLRAANTLARRRLYDWAFLSIDGRGVVSSSGLPVTPEAALSRAPGGDLLIVMPSYGFREHVTPIGARALRSATRRFRAVAGFDTGAWLLAAAGLLDGRRATIHWDEATAMAETFPEVDLRPDRFVIDGDRLTCGGVTTAFELVLHLIRRDHGAMLAAEVATLFMTGETASRRTADAPPPTDHATVAAAVALMRRHLETPLSVTDLAARVGVGRKRLEAQFQAELGAGPGAVGRALRLREARRLAETGNRSVAEIAGRCGYQDAAALTRAFRAEFGLTPRDCRRRG